MTDNGSAYRSHAFRRACAEAGLRHLRTRPYTPRTNGKAARAASDQTRSPMATVVPDKAALTL